MGNITFVAINSASAGTGNFVASAISTNFANVIAGVNSGGVNSQNYGTGASGFESYHIANQNVVSQHVADSNINLSKLASSQILSAHVPYKTVSNGVLAVRYPGGPAYGVHIAPASFTFTTGSTISTNWTTNVLFSRDCPYGTPPWTATPNMLGLPMVRHYTESADFGIARCLVTNINSASADLMISFDLNIGSFSSSARTVYMAFIGVRTG